MAVVYGASVRGPRNRRERRGNQDAWLGTHGPFGHLVVVCDGLGSRARSARGARAACAAVLRAVRHWPGAATSADVLYLVRLVEILWRLELATDDATKCATTCCFVLREPDGHLVGAGLGDGLALVRPQDGAIEQLGGRPAGAFADETVALGTPHRVSDWWTVVMPPVAGTRSVVLATDGVADDLDPGKLEGFVDWLVDDIGPLPGPQRWRRLCSELRGWPVPHHVDDKTVAVVVERGGER